MSLSLLYVSFPVRYLIVIQWFDGEYDEQPKASLNKQNAKNKERLVDTILKGYWTLPLSPITSFFLFPFSLSFFFLFFLSLFLSSFFLSFLSFSLSFFFLSLFVSCFFLLYLFIYFFFLLSSLFLSFFLLSSFFFLLSSFFLLLSFFLFFSFFLSFFFLFFLSSFFFLSFCLSRYMRYEALIFAVNKFYAQRTEITHFLVVHIWLPMHRIKHAWPSNWTFVQGNILLRDKFMPFF